MPIPDNDLPLPPFTPELGRISTAPAATGGASALGHGDAGAFMEWPHKSLADGGGGRVKAGGGRHYHRRATCRDFRADSMGSAAEWDQTLEGSCAVERPVLCGRGGVGIAAAAAVFFGRICFLLLVQFVVVGFVLSFLAPCELVSMPIIHASRNIIW